VRQSCLKEGISEEKLLEIPFGTDPNQFKPVDNLSKSEPFRVLFVGQLSFRKGVLYLLQAWRELKWRDAELWLLGRISPEMRPFLKPYYQDSSIHFLGYTPKPAQLYQQADIFVFPSIEEGSALVTYEAMASGLPTITTHNAGSLVRHGQDGFLVTIRDVNKLTEYMERLRQDTDLRRQMGRSARNHIERYPWERHGDRLAAAVNNLLMPLSI
jgi:glycosyltransferase involved in cell wall biosynthesis